jgi:hypothetical protein
MVNLPGVDNGRAALPGCPAVNPSFFIFPKEIIPYINEVTFYSTIIIS